LQGECLLIEFELLKEEFLNHTFLPALNQALSAIQSSNTLYELCLICVHRIRMLTHMDRVMVYRFFPNWDGEVIAEAKESQEQSYLHLRFPANDIPHQARLLYETNLIRFIKDTQYDPVTILSELNHPIDLSRSTLRSVSPVHVEYLTNMGVRASLSISILHEGKLWGLIACHHNETIEITFPMLQALEYFGRFFSLQLVLTQTREQNEERSRLKTHQERLIDLMRAEDTFILGLLAAERPLMKLMQATGMWVHFRGQTFHFGQSPPLAIAPNMIRWLETKLKDDVVFATDHLSQHQPSFLPFALEASGLLAIRIPEPDFATLIWFRPEILRQIRWAGNPHPEVDFLNPPERLSPRRSFSQWQETAKEHSTPWTTTEISFARDLRSALTELDLHYEVLAEKASRHEAEKSNQELDAYSDSIAHDLHEPLEALAQLSERVLRENIDLSSPLRKDLETITRTSHEATKLIKQLHAYSRLGFVDLAVTDVDLNQVLEDTLSLLKPLLMKHHAHVSLRQSLPTLSCDFARVQEIFIHLIENSVKYHDTPQPSVEVGCLYIQKIPVLFVRDNGQGFSSEKRKAFNENLHANIRSGLGIVKRIIEKHEGRMWIDSTLGSGATVFFTLTPTPKSLTSLAIHFLHSKLSSTY
jgi:two-component system, chemotaxis family, sensor kinase Cph1